jgi:OOP family OmpA-OmpF porin
MLQPPSTVQFQVDGHTVVATGSASIEWIKETRRLAALVPGITHYRDEGVLPVSIPDLLTRISRTVIHFRSGSSTVEPSERPELNAVAAMMRDLHRAVSQSGQRVRFELLGSADETGPATLNAHLSKQRAEAVQAVLGGEHVGAVTTVMLGNGTERTVTIRASVEALAEGSETVRP